MHGKDLLIYDCCNWQAVEAIGKGLPQFNVVPPLTLVIEAVNAIDRRTLVIPAKDEKILGILNFIGEKQANGFKGLFSSIDVIA